jgi:hypothetical protein
VHVLSFPLFVLSTAHGLSAGTDARTPMAVITAALAAGAVGTLGAVRLQVRAERRSSPPGRPVPAGATVATATVATPADPSPRRRPPVPVG